MLFTDAKEADNPIIFANDSFLALAGYERAEVLGQSFNFLLVQPDPRWLAQAEAEFTARSSTGLETRCRRRNGTEFWSAIFISPVRDAAGAIVQHFVSLVDLSAHKREQAQSETLIDELNHRVKNTLSTVQSIVWQALRAAAVPDAVRESVESRLFALSRSHDLLTRENWQGAGLRDLIDATLEPFGVANGRAERIVITGRNVLVAPNVTLALGVAFHELATNAVKYGAFSNAAGSISINWAVETKTEGSRLILHWQERDGPPVARPTRKGFGTRVIESGLPHELEGRVDLEYRPEGVACTIDIPAPRGARDG